MKKKTAATAFFCQSCGHQESKWRGRCPACGAWNSMIEEKTVKTTKLDKHLEKAQVITEVEMSHISRLSTDILELDRVLGGGLVAGAVTLIGGEPGAGKSTLLQMTAAKIAKLYKVLYISGEESKEQIRMSAERTGALSENLFVLAENDIDHALSIAEEISPKFLVIDSVQTVYCSELDSAMGSIAQIREVTAKVVNFAKAKGIPTFLVGHVTKDGQLAGPRLLEHMVDCVLYFEQSRSDQYRMLRAHKNRFGATNEIGLFEMSNNGLIGIKNPSAFFLAERPCDKPGSSIFCAMEGNRPLLVEIQALAVEALFGNPRRTCVGIDTTRCSVIAAVLEKHANIPLSRMDLFVSVAQGINIAEPALDIALALAIASSVKNRPLPADLVCFGELGLSGEIRRVHRFQERLKEAYNLGFRNALVPQALGESITQKLEIQLTTANSIREAIRRFLI